MKHNPLALAAKGLAMGIAEVIPGVSGGTIAFITGIYEDLIHSIKSVGPSLISTYQKDGVTGVWNAVNGRFLMFLLMGMAIGFIVGTFVITYLLDHYPEPLWGFFFGLIVGSAILIAREIKKWNLVNVGLFIVGAVVAYGITVLSPSSGSLHPAYVFISGFIAISALMLPGISGSFILLLMGMYTIIIPLIKDTIRSLDPSGLVTIGIFGLGCLMGLATFSRVLSWLFDNYKESALALLTGFLIGALNKVWPWRNLTSYMDKETGIISQVDGGEQIGNLDMEHIRILLEQNVMPAAYYMSTPKVTITIICIIVGFIPTLFLSGDKK